MKIRKLVLTCLMVLSSVTLFAQVPIFKNTPKTKAKDEPAWTMCCLCGRGMRKPSVPLSGGFGADKKATIKFYKYK